MSLLEILATAVTVACVLLAVKRSTWQYPVGIIGTILFFFVFWGAKLYASAALQVFFTFVQVYGWWYWTRGDRGKAPPITTFPRDILAAVIVGGVLLAFALSAILNQFVTPKVLFWDTAIFGLSMAAQFLLDRKKIENWIVWGAVNAISVIVYSNQGLKVAAILYAALFVNVFWGYYEWAKAKRAQKIVWDAEARKYPPAPQHEPQTGDLLP
ncbi:PnuC-like nicotinamide mononucleotide transport [Caulobacter phage CcrSC]|uniref:Ribosyl nicotinamide transporter, PnuC-like n=1 Tax=Caulobacter phage CcrSC TaxID=2283272 RepID=A0A385EGB2_9CAUD|nr:PnuC-like nicotinamide mononucleotide transport [Caulobacter phage CcrSC]AXQ69927.1 ribosyl nicotinamide transporter, PnuC-like [Caulobacter phage CcrSC]